MCAITARYSQATNARHKQIRTSNSRLNHWFQFFKGLDLDPGLINVNVGAQTIIATVYLHSLMQGDTILGFRVCYDTLKGYMNTFLQTLPNNKLAVTFVCKHAWEFIIICGNKIC